MLISFWYTILTTLYDNLVALRTYSDPEPNGTIIHVFNVFVILFIICCLFFKRALSGYKNVEERRQEPFPVKHLFWHGPRRWRRRLERLPSMRKVGCSNPCRDRIKLLTQVVTALLSNAQQ